jgi:S-methylmethionine-dependent homocysteine/selenocysteine methylase
MSQWARYRSDLPQFDGGLFLTDGGLETTLVFHEGIDLPYFAAFPLHETAEDEAVLRDYFRAYGDLAKKYDTGLILESATWRANAEWGAKLGYSARDLVEVNEESIRLLEEIRDEYESPRTRVVISGCVGPRGDGYVASALMSTREAEEYHVDQVRTFATTPADMVCAITMNYTEEAAGIARAAKRADMPVGISFTVETDGHLPTGQTLGEAIEQVDAETGGYPAYYMINCAHPTHFEERLVSGGTWTERIRGLRANASRMSHAELNEAQELDMGNPRELGEHYAKLKKRLRHLNVLGGCCGTDHRHVEQIAAACAPLFVAALM